MTTSIDEGKLQNLLGRAIVDVGAVSIAPLVLIGDRLGLYRALAAAGPLTPGQLATRTETHERYVREWLNAQAASGYVHYDAATGRYELTPEQALAFADDSSPAFIVGGFQITLAAGKIKERLKEAFKTGAGIGWHEHDHEVFHGCGRFYRSGYIGNLVQQWIPALDGVEARLKSGIRVADVGCGHGHSTILMAQAYPKSQFVGLWVASVVFGIMAFAQLLRLAIQPAVMVAGHEMPLWPSVIAAAVLASLCIWLGSLTRSARR